MKLLGLDLETGADFSGPKEKNFITEIGAVVWDTDYKAPVLMFSKLIDEPDVPSICEEAELYSGISEKMRKSYGVHPLAAITELVVMISGCDYIVAHNGLAFDKPILTAFFGRYNMEFPTKVWIDTQYDVSYPKQATHRSLTYLAGYHGFCNPFPHRAVSDVLTMFKVLNNYDLGNAIEVAKSKKYLIKANVSYDNKDLAKAAGFYWDGPTKSWLKKINEIDLEAKKNLFGFTVNVLEEIV